MTQPRPDSRAPLVVDTRPLGRRPGSMRTEQRVVPNPGALAVGMTGVPEDGEIELDLRLEAVMEGVLVTGQARTRMAGECSRCLDPVAEPVEAGFQELFRYPLDDEIGGVAAGAEADAEAEDEDYYLEGDLIDLEQVVRDAVVLALPLSPLCRDDCPGLCAECGVKLADAGPEHGHDDRVDPRWEALRALGEEPGDR
ncbi:YceD family protein [Marinactinospora rubrisoli]|uniref:YceD family protein n=1 Tax=Marinactinospora rubrisoli TaxID=2715399 RepID=A0ABW2KFC7_9ACTN